MKRYKHILKNRQDAAKKLKEVLPIQRLRDENWKIIALSSGGLSLASSLIAKMHNRLDFLFSEAINAPHNDECEIARVSENEEIVINDDLVKAFEIGYDYVYGEAHRKYEEKIISYIYQYRKGRHFFDIENSTVLLVDDGSESGLKFATALKTVMAQKPKAVYIAVPVIPSDVLEVLKEFSDEVFFLYSIDDYVKTSLYYEEFEEITDEMIEKLLGDK